MSMNDTHRGHADLLDLVQHFRGREIWIVGDLMLDEYVLGGVERISPEAPVPVVRAIEEQVRLGGAANVARQVAALGGHAVLGGIVGNDDTGRQLTAQCEAHGIDTRGVVRDPRRRTTRKLRILGHGQQLVRLDWEDIVPCEGALAAELGQQMRIGPKPDVVILSDYAKGVLTDPVIAQFVRYADESRCRILVDPKRTDLATYRGASLLTPNVREMSQAAGRGLDPDDHSDIAAAAAPFISRGGFEGIVVTLSDRGMLYVGADGSRQHIPAERRAVADVTGAGDTAMAVLATALASGASVEQAMNVANIAAGLAVSEVGAVAITPEQIRRALSDAFGGKVLDRSTLAERVAAWRASGKRIVFTNGCFDLLHTGHLTLLQNAAKLGDRLILAINSDGSVRRLKGESRPIVSAGDRAALLAALACVDAVTIFDEDTPHELLRIVRPHVLVKGEDYGLTEVVGREVVEADGGRVVLIPLIDERSTSAIVERIREPQRASVKR